jgi:hypothetical protein
MMRASAAVIFLFALSVAQAEVAQPDPTIPVWASKVDCGHHAHLAPHKKIAVNHPLSDAEQQLRAEYEEEALDWLRLAQERANRGDVSEEVCYALEYAKLGALSPEELKTTPGQLKELQLRGWRAEAVRQYNLAKEHSASGSGDAAEEMARAREFAEQVVGVAEAQ